MAETKMTGTTGRMRFSGNDLKEFEIPVPSLAEQGEVVTRLEDLLSRISAAGDYVDRGIRRLKAFRDAGLADAIRIATHATGTSLTTVQDLGRVSSGMTPLKVNRAFYQGGTVPWITSGDLYQGVITKPTQFVTQKALDETSLRIVPAGSLLVAMYGEGKTRGTAAELGVDATTNQACAAVVLDDPELKPWIRLVLDANYSKLRRLAAGGVQPNLNLSIIKSIAVPIPDTSLRLELLERRSSLDESAQRLRLSLEAADWQIQNLRRSALAAAFSGRLTPGVGVSAAGEMILA